MKLWPIHVLLSTFHSRSDSSLLFRCLCHFGCCPLRTQLWTAAGARRFCDSFFGSASLRWPLSDLVYIDHVLVARPIAREVHYQTGSTPSVRNRCQEPSLRGKRVALGLHNVAHRKHRHVADVNETVQDIRIVLELREPKEYTIVAYSARYFKKKSKF